MNDLEWDDIRLFLAVAETGSMSAAARQLRTGQPTVSRRLALLESRLGYALFRRSAQGVACTAAGERLLAPARKMAEWAGEVGRASGPHDGRPRGVVRLTAPPGVAWDFVAPFAAWLKTRQPGVQLEVLSSINYLDLARGEADLALRLRPAPPGDLVTVASVRHSNSAMAARSYVSRLPRRYGLADLAWIGWAPPYDQLPPNPQLRAMIPGFQPVFTADNLLVQRQAAEAGVGAIVTGAVWHRFSRPTRLVPLKLDLGAFARGELHLVAARSALDVPRIRAVAELLAEEMARVRSPDSA
jgi:DNA-binding transcriptional LysR family regulator